MKEVDVIIAIFCIALTLEFVLCSSTCFNEPETHITGMTLAVSWPMGTLAVLECLYRYEVAKVVLKSENVLILMFSLSLF